MLASFLKRILSRNADVDTSDALLRPDLDATQLAELGWLRHSAGDAPGAERFARQALALSADTPSAHELLARLALPGIPYLELLKRIHALVRPATYCEIGVFEGDSLALASAHTDAIGIDPAPIIGRPLSARTRLFAQTSNDFFATHDLRAEFGGRALELAFIDGMHQFEFALRDFVNLEKACARDSWILLHDCYPIDEVSAARERRSGFWSGDIWRTILALKKYRPDLDVVTIASPPTGLGLVRSLDPGSRVLADRYDEIVRDLASFQYSSLHPRKAELLGLVAGDWDRVRRLFTTG
jgi:hypothetical protein